MGWSAFDHFVNYLQRCHIIFSIISKQKPTEMYEAPLLRSLQSNQWVKGDKTTGAKLGAQALGKGAVRREDE